MLYIQLRNGISTDSEEVAPNILLDYDDSNSVIGIEIEDASKRMELSKLSSSRFVMLRLLLAEASRV